jgi:hypothetical protein
MPGLTEIFGMEASWARCTTCGLPFQFPKYLCDWASTHNKPLYCPMGHANDISWSNNTPRRMEERLMEQANEIVSLGRKNASLRGQLTKLKKKRKR